MNHKVLLNCVVGSTAYNLRTPESDMDYRRVVTPMNLSYFFGLDKFDVGFLYFVNLIFC